MASEGEEEERKGEGDERNPPGEVSVGNDSGEVPEDGRSTYYFDYIHHVIIKWNDHYNIRLNTEQFGNVNVELSIKRFNIQS